MTKLLSLLTLAFALTLAACGDAENIAEETTEDDNVEAAVADNAPTTVDDGVQMVDGVQVAEIEVGRQGYAPGTVELEAAVPARLVFTRTIESACAEQVQAPELGVPLTDLPLNEPVAVEFTPGEAGTFTYVCGMDMMRGTVVVQA